jgi:hypothetical protein
VEKDTSKASADADANERGKVTGNAPAVTRHVTCHGSETYSEALPDAARGVDPSEAHHDQIPSDLRPITAYVSSAALANMGIALAEVSRTSASSALDAELRVSEPASFDSRSTDPLSAVQPALEQTKAKSPAERKREHRERLKERGLHEVQVVTPLDPVATDLVRRLAVGISVSLANSLSQWAEQAGDRRPVANTQGVQSSDDPVGRLVESVTGLLRSTAAGRLSLETFERIIHDHEFIERLMAAPEVPEPLVVSDPALMQLLRQVQDNPDAVSIASQVVIRVQQDPDFADVASTLAGAPYREAELRAAASYMAQTVPAPILVEVMEQAGRVKPFLSAIMRSDVVSTELKLVLRRAARLRKDPAFADAIDQALADRHLRQRLVDLAGSWQNGKDDEGRAATSAEHQKAIRRASSVGSGRTYETRSNARRPIPGERKRERSTGILSFFARLRARLREMRRVSSR